jgi:hypothetical protein
VKPAFFFISLVILFSFVDFADNKSPKSVLQQNVGAGLVSARSDECR